MAKKTQVENKLLPEKTKLCQLLDTCIADPHSILGMHFDEKLKSLVIRCFEPTADNVFLVRSKAKKQEMDKIHDAGLFAIELQGEKEFFPYELEKVYGKSSYKSADPYFFMPGIGDLDTYLFNQGEHHNVYEIMGAHEWQMGDIKGIRFTVWAPSAKRVSLVGNFNNWDGRRNMMRVIGTSGIWELFIPNMKAGEIYKFEIKDQHDNIFLKLDPYAYQTELRPNTGGITTSNKKFKWNDKNWISKREKSDWYESPISIYEVHLASWQGPGLRPIDPENEDDFHNYREIAHALADYVLEMGFTHIELLPIMEHPLDQSWGYQVTANFAPTARYGTPEDFAYFVDYMHSKGIGVFLDWVPAHFPKDAFAMGRFDGTGLYEHIDPKQGEHRDWGTYIYNYSRCEVRNYLIGNALYWLERFHIDGLRVDAVASMLYLDYSREDDDWVPNEYGGNENIAAISFMKRLNELTNEKHPGTLIIAEESTAWPMVSRPVYLGGLGFSYKWNMGWMHDTLSYFALDPIHRSYHHHDVTFSMLYAFSENFILPLSHDEVVHGKGALLSKMSGDYWQKFANLRALYTYMMTHPGKKLLFMGGEFGQWNEWNCNTGLDWMLLEYPAHQKLQALLKDANKLYSSTKALYENELKPEGFEWVDANDSQQSVFSFLRWDKNGKDPVVVIMNLTPVPRYDYRIGVPKGGKWEEAFNSDANKYGGSGVVNEKAIDAELQEFHNKPYSISITLPPLGAVVFKQKK